MKTQALSILRAGAWLALLPAIAYAESPPLPAMGADLSQTSVSGISSGGFMAAQLATAYSASFMGVGVIAAGPYYCAGTFDSLSWFDNATTTCMAPSTQASAAKAGVSWEHAKRFAADGKIDAVANLARQRVYVFSGAGDHTVKTVVADEVEKYYGLADTPKDQIWYRKHSDAGHSIVTDKSGDVACQLTEPPFINNCGFVQSHELLRHIYRDKTGAPNKGVPAGQMIAFNQGEFVKGSRSSMDEDAYVYVPEACKANACAVHVAFHGCQQGARQIGERFYMGTGYNEFADTNKLIVLYPQARASTGIPPNPKGCWDFWGYSGETEGQADFHTRAAPQMAAVIAMIKRLGQARGAQLQSLPPTTEKAH